MTRLRVLNQAALLVLLAPVADASPLAKPIGAAEGGVQLRDRVEGLSRAVGSTAFVDRRVDPHLTLGPTDAGLLGDALRASLRGARIGVADVGGVVYVGPQGAAGKVRTLAALAAQQSKAMSPAARAALQRVDSLSWPRLTEPRELVVSLASAHGVAIENPAVIPHDLWRAGRLPPMTLSDRLTLLLVGFDLSWSPAADGASVRLAPIPGTVEITRRHRGPDASRWDLESFRRQRPTAQLERRRGRWELTGTIEDHEKLEVALGNRPSPPATLRETEQRLTLTVDEQPAQAVLDKLARAFMLQIRYQDGAAAEVRTRLQQKISLRVTQAPLAELLHQVGEPLGLRIERSADQLLVSLVGG